MHEQIIEIERRWWKYAAAKDQHVREVLGVNSTAYYAALNAMLDDVEAERRWPMEVRRLRRVREVRRAARQPNSRNAPS